MNLFFRILLAVYAFCLTIISLVTVAITIKPVIFTNLAEYVTVDVWARRIVFVVASVFLILSLMFLFSGIRSDKDKKSVTKHTNVGEIKISLTAIENIALSASRRLNGVRESKANVTRLDDSVSIAIKTIVQADTNIPALSEDIQVKVKSLVEETTGIIVNDVKVVVENIYTGYKTRVE